MGKSIRQLALERYRDERRRHLEEDMRARNAVARQVADALRKILDAQGIDIPFGASPDPNWGTQILFEDGLRLRASLGSWGNLELRYEQWCEVCGAHFWEPIEARTSDFLAALGWAIARVEGQLKDHRCEQPESEPDLLKKLAQVLQEVLDLLDQEE